VAAVAAVDAKVGIGSKHDPVGEYSLMRTRHTSERLIGTFVYFRASFSAGW